jgi:EmrB/QacA subfamily drug resistance transporter
MTALDERAPAADQAFRVSSGPQAPVSPPIPPAAGRTGPRRKAHRAPGPTHNRWLVLAALIGPLTVIVLDTTVLNLALKTLADPVAGLGASPEQLQWVVNIYTLAFAGLLLSFGILADRYGQRRLLFLGVVVFTTASAVAAYAPNPPLLILTRLVMGIGSAAVMPTSLSLVSTVFEPSQRPRALGIWAGSVGLGAAAGPILGGVMLAHFWWGSVFLINVPIGAVAAVAVAALVPEAVVERPDRIDAVGVGLSIAAVATLAYAVIRAGQQGFADPTVLAMLAGSGVLLAVFVQHARRSPYPALDVRLFKKRQFSGAAGVVALVFAANWGLLFFSTFYLQLVRGLNTQEAGLVMLPFAVAQVLFSSRAPALVRMFGARKVSVSGLLLAALAIGGYGVIGAGTSLWLYALLQFLQGVSLAIVVPPALISIMGAVPREKAGAASAVFQVSRQVATALGVSLVGSIVTAVYRSSLTRDLPALTRAIPALTPDQHAAASQSVSAGYATARLLGPAGMALADAVQRSFLTALHTGAVAAASLAALGAVIAQRALPAAIRRLGRHAHPGAGARSATSAWLWSTSRRRTRAPETFSGPDQPRQARRRGVP